MMLALLLALAPVTQPVEYWHPRAPIVHPFFGNCAVETKCSMRVAPEWREHCTAAARIWETGQPLECETDTADDLYSLCRRNGGTPPQCAAEDAWVNDEISYCIWRSDGTVEAKNATCSDRKGERQ